MRCAPLHLALAVCRARRSPSHGPHPSALLILFYSCSEFLQPSRRLRSHICVSSTRISPSNCARTHFHSFKSWLFSSGPNRIFFFFFAASICIEQQPPQRRILVRLWLRADVGSGTPTMGGTHGATGDPLRPLLVAVLTGRLSSNHLCKPQNRLWLSLAARTQTTAPPRGLPSGNKGLRRRRRTGARARAFQPSVTITDPGFYFSRHLYKHLKVPRPDDWLFELMLALVLFAQNRLFSYSF